MVLNIYVKFHETISNDFDLTEWTREYELETAIINVQRAITQKVCNPEIRFLRSARHLMVLNILNGFEVIERK